MNANISRGVADSIRTQSFRRYNKDQQASSESQSAQGRDSPQLLADITSAAASDWDAMLQARHRAGSTIAGGGRRASFVTTAAVCVSPPPPPPPPPPPTDDIRASLASGSISIRVSGSAAHPVAASVDSRVSVVAPSAGAGVAAVSTILIRKQRICASNVASASSSSFFAFSSRRSRSTGRLVLLRRPRCQRLADHRPLPSVASESPALIGVGAHAASAHAEIEMQRLDAAPRRRRSKSDRIPCALAQPILFALRASPALPSKSISPLMLFDFPVAPHRRSTVSGPAPAQLAPSPPPPMKRTKSLWI